LTRTARSCGTCSLCCKVLDIDELEKPAGAWCRHAKPGKGCGIHGQHPEGCQAFACMWMRHPEMPEDWRPDRAGFVVREMPAKLLLIDVDEGRPVAWKREPYYSQIKRWAAAARGQGAVIVRVGGRGKAVFPEADVDIGPATKTDHFVTSYELRDGQQRPVVRVTRACGEKAEYRE